MKDFNDLYYFAKVIEYGGFSAASNELMVTKSLLSRRIAELEKRLGVKLLHRNTRNISITEVGKIYYQHCQAMIIEAEAADTAIEMLSIEPAGTVKISCPVNLLHFNVSKMLNDFLIKFPKVRLHVEATNRKVDLINERYDVAIRIRPLPLEDSDLVVRDLSLSKQFIVASPELAYKHFSIKHPSELNQWPILMMESFVPEYNWRLFNENNEQYLLKCEPRLTTTDLNALHLATLQGLGIAKLPELIIHNDLKEGRLVKVLPDWEPKPELIHLAYTSRRGLLPSVKALIDFLIAEFEKY
ncbi:LysR family transcriptional regulator [Acinetobacter sp. ACNIH2]|jgi:DNA-binding transcriptional LysR family regulator|uniref:LysR substrate-binding domain-containing protein n=1 Tax=Acinetobacter sp. ACNIH2 TaxID=1758189 RepID=UPI0005CD5406|nr:LysR substrate-binding domain-containing protein [Acinetobacter sp. ACNIH2]AUX85897.1 LysR family transcriptional regulator [Acinetobacter sp. ACNIH2]